MQIEMAGRPVGDGEPCLVVAEIGENHMMDPGVACALIEEAALAGVDAVKFQTARPEELYNPSDPDIEECAAAELDLGFYPRLVETARANNVIFFSTPFDERSADFLDQLNVPFFKIGSGELTHHTLLRHVARKGKPMVVSTGMAGLDWIKAAVRVIQDAGNDQIIITHCVSLYPAPVELANVRAIPALREQLGVSGGLVRPHHVQLGSYGCGGPGRVLPGKNTSPYRGPFPKGTTPCPLSLRSSAAWSTKSGTWKQLWVSQPARFWNRNAIFWK